MSADPQRVEALLVEAAALADPAARAAYLSEACAGDAELRREVESLLAAHDEAGAFLETPADGARLSPGAAGDSHEAAAGEATRAPIEQAGQLIGRYTLLEKIGEGGFGDVWLAEQEEPVRRRVALKIIKLGMDTREVLARFDAERQALALMDHPNIAKIFDGGVTGAGARLSPAAAPSSCDTPQSAAERLQDNQAAAAEASRAPAIPPGRPYFVMELVRGPRITDYCDQHQFAVRERLDLFVQVCHAVQHAHQKGVIHRDLKPSNILVTEQDTRPVPKVIDFGIAKAIEGRLTDQTVTTRFAQFLGTPAYMSPEQADWTSRDIDTRSDIYSLGVLLYELLTGHTPFDTRVMLEAGLDEVRRVIREVDPPKPSTRLSKEFVAADVSRRTSNSPPRDKNSADLRRRLQEVRGDLDWIVMKCLEKDRTRRYDTANGLAKDIQRHLHHEPVTARAPSRLYRFKKLLRRNRLAFALSGAVALALVLGLTVSLRLLFKERDARARAEAAEEKSEASVREAYLAQARANRFSGRPGRRFDSLTALRKSAAIQPGLDIRNEAIACLALPDLRTGKRLAPGPDGRAVAAVDAQYRHYARADDAGNIAVLRLSDDALLASFGLPGYAAAILEFSGDGRFLAVKHDTFSFTPDNVLQVWNLEQRQPVLHLTNVVVDRAFEFHPRSDRIAVGQRDGTILIHELPGGRLVSQAKAGVQPHSLRFSPDATELAVASYAKPMAVVLNLSNGNVRCTLPHPDAIRRVAWHPSGRLLATACADRQVYLWQMPEGRQRAALEGHKAQVVNVEFSQDGELLASAGWDSHVCLWDPLAQNLLMRSPGKAAQLQFDPRAERLGLVVEADGIHVVDLDQAAECRSLVSHMRTNAFRGTFSPDGRLLAVATEQGIVLWDTARRSAAAHLPMFAARTALFAPDAKNLLVNGYHLGAIQRWPIVTANDAERTLRLGPPVDTKLPLKMEAFALIPGTTKVAIAYPGGGEIVNLERPTNSIRLPVPGQAPHIAVSPDGKWIATSPYLGEDVTIWEASSGRMVRTLPMRATVRLSANVLFSPDGRWLVTGTRHEYRLWDVATWETRHRFAAAAHYGHMSFSPDGRILAVSHSPQTLKLLDPVAGHELATLPGEVANPLCFSPDGTQLVIIEDRTNVRVWNLRLVRQRLAAMNLDWNLPPYPPAPEGPQPKPLRVEVMAN